MNWIFGFYTLIISWLIIQEIDGSCDIIGDYYFKNKEIHPIKIGGYKYSAYDSQFFIIYGASLDRNPKIKKYPFQQINPYIAIDTNLQRAYTSSDKQQIGSLIKNNLTDLKIEMDVTNVFLILLAKGNLCNYIYMLYNDDQTILYAKFDKIPEDLYFNVGKGLGEDMTYSKLPKMDKSKGTFVYDVTGTSAKRIGCITAPLKFPVVNILEMNKYRLSRYGSERVWFRGPCELDKSSQAIKSIDFTHLKLKEIKISFLVTYIKKENKFYCGSTPIIWYTGQYEATLDLVGKRYKVDIDVYEPTEYGIDIYEQAKIDSGTEYLSEVQLNIKSDKNYTDKKVLFRILEFQDSNETPRPHEMEPIIITRIVQCFGDIKRCTVKSNDITTDHGKRLLSNKVMGYFETFIETESFRSKIFSVLWLLLENGTKFESEFRNGQMCQSYLKSMTVLNNKECPITLNRVKTTTSIFKLSQTENQNLECYKGYFGRQKASGIMCCYNASSELLITGSANFINQNNTADNKLQGSYRWKYLPSQQPNQHFLFDRLPLLSCCSMFDKVDPHMLNKKNNLCRLFWSKLHNISAVNSPLDYAGNLFGDPHIIGFSFNDIQYSYLLHGFYSLFQVKDKLDVIGLFYAGSEISKTVLQYLVIKFDKNFSLGVIPIHNKAGTLSWTILKSGREVTMMPYYEKGFMVSQSANGSVLSIYTLNSEEFSVKIDLTRHFKFLLPFTYMDLELFVQVPNKNSNLLLEGLFGTVNVTKGEIKLKEKDSKFISSLDKVPTTYDKLVQTWRVQSKDMKFDPFFDTSEIEILNSPIQPITVDYKSNAKCNGNKFCEIDIDAFPNTNIYQSTLAAVAKRSEYNAVEKKSVIVPENCPYPSFNDWILDSIDTSIGSVCYVIGCYGSTSKFDQSAELTCTKSNQTNGIPYWNVSISDWSKVCIKIVPSTSGPVTTDTSRDSTSTTTTASSIVYIATGGAVAGILLIIAVIIVFILCVCKDRFVKSDVNESKSKDNVAMENIYE